MKRHRGSYRGYYSNNSGAKLKVIVRKEDEMEVYNGVESMIDLKNGTIKIADGLTISPDYTFDKFKKSSFYKNQDGIRIIYLEKQQVIDGINYMVSLFFRDNKIYVVSLVCCEEQYSEENEKERKKLHDQILERYGVIERKEFMWGQISSDYDARSNCCRINFFMCGENR